MKYSALDKIEMCKNDIVDAKKQMMDFYLESLKTVSEEKTILEHFRNKDSLANWYYDYIFNVEAGEYLNFEEYIIEYSAWKK